MPQCAEFFYADHFLCAVRSATGAIMSPHVFIYRVRLSGFRLRHRAGLLEASVSHLPMPRFHLRAGIFIPYLVSRLSWIVVWVVIDDSNQTLSSALLSESSPLPCNEPRNRKPHGTTTELTSWCGTPSCLSIDGFLLKCCGVDFHHA